MCVRTYTVNNNKIILFQFVIIKKIFSNQVLRIRDKMASTGTAMGTRMGTGAIKRPQTASQTFFATSSHLLPSNLFQIPDGRFTFTIYSLIKQKRFEDVIAVLENELRTRTATRASLSLLAYAHFQLSNFDLAASIYETLLTSEIGSSSAAAGGSSDSASNKYKLYLAQCFYRAGAYDKAEEVCLDLSSSSSITSNMALEVFNSYFFLYFLISECLPSDVIMKFRFKSCNLL